MSDSSPWVWSMQDSVPHLKARLQLQQVIMKELLQKIIAEKRNASVATSAPSSFMEASTSQRFTVSAPQPVTAVQVAPMATSSAVGLVASGNPAAVAGSKVTMGAAVPNSSSGLLQLPQAFSAAALESLSMQLPKVLRDKIVKLPKEQQRFVYMHHLRQLQGHRQPKVAASSKVVLEKQQRLVQEQQVPLVVGVSKPGVSVRGVSATVSVGSSAGDGGKGKGNFATMRIVPGGSASPGSKRKGKGKDVGQDVE